MGDRLKSERVPYLTSRLQGFGESIFAEMSALAISTNSINLGQGFPDTDGPLEISEAAIAAIREGHNQYPPGVGIPALREQIAAHQRHFYDLTYDPDTEVLVTAGATEAIAASLLALVEVGDEVVMFEPYFDAYAGCAAMSGATRKVVTLNPPDYWFNFDALREAVTDKTRILLLNSPHNPTGKVFTRDELESIAEICVERDLIVISDEVYEHLTFDDNQHIPIATLPGMRDRTITISSAGKTFSFTGWKIGWACAPAPLLNAVRNAKQFLTYVNGAPFQHAIAFALSLPDHYYAELATDLQKRRDQLCEGLERVGFDVFSPGGTYFVTADISLLGEADGLEFCRRLPVRCGVVAVPNIAFYDNEAAGRSLVRFAFCKKPEVLDEAIGRLMVLKRS